MSRTNSDQELKVALDAFEATLITPVVSGELEVWGEAVRENWKELSPRVELQLTRLHPTQYAEMTEEDPEMFAQIENLQSTDAALHEERLALDQHVHRLSTIAPLIEPDESKFHDFQARLRKKGGDFVTHIKEQQIAIQTGYLEAFSRDRGIAD